MKIRNYEFDFTNNTYVMGILNVTPDSFSDGGNFSAVDVALKHVGEMIAEGADFIDIGGESTRPGHDPVSAQVEMERIIPVIEEVRRRFDIPISVDTYKSETLEAAIKAGADIANDVWGFKRDPLIASVAAKYGVPVILMHNREDMNYNNRIEDMKTGLMESIQYAITAGVQPDNIMIDPGIGFAQDYFGNLEVMNRLEAFVEMGYPVLLGTSRKRFIGQATEQTVPVDRVMGTAVTTTIGVLKGVSIVRVHDVRENVDAIKMTRAIMSVGK